MVSIIEILLIGLTTLGGGLFRSANSSFDPVQSSPTQGFAPQPSTIETVMEEAPLTQEGPISNTFNQNTLTAEQQRQARRRKLFPLAFKRRVPAGFGITQGTALNQQGRDLLSGRKNLGDFNLSTLRLLFRNPLIQQKFL